jgi:hypothetical protein
LAAARLSARFAAALTISFRSRSGAASRHHDDFERVVLSEGLSALRSIGKPFWRTGQSRRGVLPRSRGGVFRLGWLASGR